MYVRRNLVFSMTQYNKATPQNKSRGLDCVNSSVRPKIKDIIVLPCPDQITSIFKSQHFKKM